MLKAVVALSLVVQAQYLYDGPPHACVQRDDLVKHLEKLGESQVGMGLRHPNGIVELWRNSDPADPTFSIIITRPNGDSCLVGQGSEWIAIEDFKPKPPGTDS